MCKSYSIVNCLVMTVSLIGLPDVTSRLLFERLLYTNYLHNLLEDGTGHTNICALFQQLCNVCILVGFAIFFVNIHIEFIKR